MASPAFCQNAMVQRALRFTLQPDGNRHSPMLLSNAVSRKSQLSLLMASTASFAPHLTIASDSQMPTAIPHGLYPLP